MAGLAVDYNIWKQEQTALQRAVEVGAYSAAMARARGADDPLPYARAIIEANGFDPDSDNLQLSLDGDSVNVEMTREAKRYLSALFEDENLDIGADAAAGVEKPEETEVAGGANGNDKGYPCVVAYQADSPAQRGIYMHNTANITLKGCGVHSNSNAVQSDPWVEEGSIYLRNASIEADSIRAVGEAIVNTSNGASSTSVEPESSSYRFNDPFAALEPPRQGPCDLPGRTVNFVQRAVTLTPGTYCGDIIVQNGGKARFAPGVYHIVNGDFLVRGGARIENSTDVTFYFGGDRPGKWIIDNGTDVVLSAPNGGEAAGMLFWQSAEADCDTGYNGQNRFAGGADFSFEGVIYAPGCGLVIDNNTHLEPAYGNSHMSIHAAWIEMRGSAALTARGRKADPELARKTGYTEKGNGQGNPEPQASQPLVRLRFK
jgi:hypothetical protein